MGSADPGLHGLHYIELQRDIQEEFQLEPSVDGAAETRGLKTDQ